MILESANVLFQYDDDLFRNDRYLQFPILHTIALKDYSNASSETIECATVRILDITTDNGNTFYSQK